MDAPGKDRDVYAAWSRGVPGEDNMDDEMPQLRGPQSPAGGVPGEAFAHTSELHWLFAEQIDQGKAGNFTANS